MKKQIIFLLIICFIISGCQINIKNPDTNTKTDENSTADASETTTEITSDDETIMTMKEGELMREDENGLVKISIKDGKAEIEFDIEKWDALYNIYEYAAEQYDISVLEKGPFPILNYHYEVNITDVCIGKIEPNAYEDYSLGFPTLIFLLADGTLEYSEANPVLANISKEQYLHYKLEWLKDITSLSYEDYDNSGQKAKTIYAIDKNGDRYDTRISNALQNIIGETKTWYAPLLENPSGESNYYGGLYFENDNRVWFYIFSPENIGEENKEEPSIIYCGQYQVFLAEDHLSGYSPGTIMFELKMDSTSNKDESLKNLPLELRCFYYPEIQDLYAIRFWHVEEDYLFSLNGKHQDSCLFQMSYSFDNFYRNFNNTQSETNEDVNTKIKWVVAPELEYDKIYYCSDCGLFGPDFSHEGDILDPKTGLVTRDKNIIGNGWQGHSIGRGEWLYDETKGLYGIYFTDAGGDYLEMCSKDIFGETIPFSYYTDAMLAFRKADFSKIKQVDSEWDFIEYDLSGAYIGDKYALAYGTNFITDFVYDEYDAGHHVFAVRMNGKWWGIIDKFGITIAPFIFEDIILIDDSTAFAKYNGKYGILEIAYG